MIRSRHLGLVLRGVAISFLAAAVLPSSAQEEPAGEAGRQYVWREVTLEEADVRALTPRGVAALQLPDMGWQHVETDHFVLHFQRVMFARKVARMAEFFYTYIADELEAVKDRVEGRSHIFLFRSPGEWQTFLRAGGVRTEWAFSLVEGPVLFLQQAENTKESGNVLAHEMTHLVLNRFFKGSPPLWLNEGLAEWYEEFGYAAFKGTKKSRRPQFRGGGSFCPLEALVALDRYPASADGIRSFYETSKSLVGYLMLEWSPKRIVPFTEDMIRGEDLLTALERHYAIGSIEALQQGFDRFVR